MTARSVGLVTTIRVRPDDQMACIDLVQKAGVLRDGMSLTAIISRALAIACETFRSSGTIPTREGFEFADMIAPYENTTIHARRARIKVGHELVLADVTATARDKPRVPAIEVNADEIAVGLSSQFADEEQALRYFRWKDALPAQRNRIPLDQTEHALFRSVLSKEKPPTAKSVAKPTPERTRTRNQTRIDELVWKRDNDGENWTSGEERELARLMKQVKAPADAYMDQPVTEQERETIARKHRRMP